MSFADLALFLDAQNLAQIDAGDRHERRALLLGLDGETGVMDGNVDLADEGVGRFDRGDPGQRQLFGQAILQG